jgi:hypothetical protein
MQSFISCGAWEKSLTLDITNVLVAGIMQHRGLDLGVTLSMAFSQGMM